MLGGSVSVNPLPITVQNWAHTPLLLPLAQTLPPAPPLAHLPRGRYCENCSEVCLWLPPLPTAPAHMRVRHLWPSFSVSPLSTSKPGASVSARQSLGHIQDLRLCCETSIPHWGDQLWRVRQNCQSKGRVLDSEKNGKRSLFCFIGTSNSFRS